MTDDADHDALVRKYSTNLDSLTPEQRERFLRAREETQQARGADAEPATGPPDETSAQDHEAKPTRWLTNDEYPADILIRGWPWYGDRPQRYGDQRQ
jgi:hypothetical protein